LSGIFKRIATAVLNAAPLQNICKMPHRRLARGRRFPRAHRGYCNSTRRARDAAESISEHATGVLYDKQQYLKLLQSVAVAANESPSLDDALQATVDQMSTHLGWPVAHAYLAIGTTSILTLSDIWFIGDLERFENFRRAVETTLVAPSVAVAGHALAERAPVATTELEGVWPLPLAAAAREAGLISALAFPIVGIDAPVAVLEFFSTEKIVPDDMLTEVIARIGDLLGKTREVRAQHRRSNPRGHHVIAACLSRY